MSFEIAPLRALRFDTDKLAAQGVSNTSALVSPPYDIIGTDEHADLLSRSDYNIVRLTLGETPGEKEDYRARGERILDWQSRGVLRRDETPAIYVYGCDYTVPGTDISARFRGVASLGRLHKFEEGVVLPHERTFPRVVDDRRARAPPAVVRARGAVERHRAAVARGRFVVARPAHAARMRRARCATSILRKPLRI